MIRFGIVLLSLAILLILKPAPEPVYKGRPLSYWIEEYGGRKWAYYGQPQSYRGPPEFTEAVEYFGTNALPLLARWVRYEPPSYWKWDNRFWVRQLHKIKFMANHIERRNYLGVGALHAFQQLGPRATPAIPDLNRMLPGLKWYEIQRPIFALAAIGPDALPTLQAAVTNRNLKCRITVAFAIVDNMGTDAARSVVPFLLDWLKEPDPVVRSGAAAVLGRCRFEPERVIPALVARLSDTYAPARANAVSGLGYFGTNARSANPAISNALNDPDSSVRNFATNALRHINPL